MFLDNMAAKSSERSHTILYNYKSSTQIKGFKIRLFASVSSWPQKMAMEECLGKIA